MEYDIKLHPDLENFIFGGVETITLLLLKPTKTLTLHSKEIDIETASASGKYSLLLHIIILYVPDVPHAHGSDDTRNPSGPWPP